MELLKSIIVALRNAFRTTIETKPKDIDDAEYINISLSALADFRLCCVFDLHRAILGDKSEQIENMLLTLQTKETFNLIQLVKDATTANLAKKDVVNVEEVSSAQ